MEKVWSNYEQGLYDLNLVISDKRRETFSVMLFWKRVDLSEE